MKRRIPPFNFIKDKMDITFQFLEEKELGNGEGNPSPFPTEEKFPLDFHSEKEFQNFLQDAKKRKIESLLNWKIQTDGNRVYVVYYEEVGYADNRRGYTKGGYGMKNGIRDVNPMKFERREKTIKEVIYLTGRGKKKGIDPDCWLFLGKNQILENIIDISYLGQMRTGPIYGIRITLITRAEKK